jgi:nucleoside-diphosphate-sugar epimerase
MTERVLVTGSEGCIGAWAVRDLVRRGIPVVGMDVSPAGMRLDKVLDPDERAQVTTVFGDLRDASVLDTIIAEQGITRIVHLAAMQVPFVAAAPVLGLEVNVVGTVRVLEAARNAGGQIRGLSYASSAGAIGPIESPHEPSTLYGVSKLANEHTARIYARDYGVPSIGLRPCVVYGVARDQGLTAALTHAIKAAVLDVEYRVPFGGSLDLQYAADVAAAFVQAALVDGNSAAPVFDLHGEAVTVPGFLETLERVVPGSAARISFSDAAEVPGNVDARDDDLIRLVGPLPKTPLEAGITETAARLTAHRDAGVLSAAEIPS